MYSLSDSCLKKRLKITILFLILLPNVICFPKKVEEKRIYSPFYISDQFKYCDSSKIDFSLEYLRLTSPNLSTDKDITNKVKNYEIKADTIFSSIRRFYDNFENLECVDIHPQNGVLGNNYQRIQMYISPHVKQKDSLSFEITGKSKVNRNICNFHGIIKIIYIIHHSGPYRPYYSMVGEYEFKETYSQNGSGVFKGICSFNIKIDNIKKTINLDEDNDVADGYENCTFVGTWTDYKTAVVKKCIWGDFRLPFTFDFDEGAGEIIVNSKYRSNMWDSYMSGDEYYEKDGKYFLIDKWWE